MFFHKKTSPQFLNIIYIEYADDTTLECSGNTFAVGQKRNQHNVNIAD